MSFPSNSYHLDDKTAAANKLLTKTLSLRCYTKGGDKSDLLLSSANSKGWAALPPDNLGSQIADWYVGTCALDEMGGTGKIEGVFLRNYAYTHKSGL